MPTNRKGKPEETNENPKQNRKTDPWKHRSKGMRCATCIWAVEKQPDGPEKRENWLGRCRRHAPTMNGYPAIFATDWCGDHKLDENKL